jgi:hypothetical protein
MASVTIRDIDERLKAQGELRRFRTADKVHYCGSYPDLLPM